MRCMAIGAVLARGRVLPKKGTSLLLVAGVTSLIDGSSPQELLASSRAVGLVAANAGKSRLAPFVAEQMSRPLQRSLTLLRVTGGAEFCIAALD